MIIDNPPPADALKLETHTPEIERRLGTEHDEATLGHLHLQDTMRAATISLAERGDAKAVAQVRRWLDDAADDFSSFSR